MSQNYPVIPAGQSLSSSLVDILDRDDSNRSLFSGPVEPTVMVAHMLWADTATVKLKQRDTANNAWNILSDLNVAGGGLLRRDGTLAMTAALNMGTQLINNVVDPVGPQDAATKAFVELNSFEPSYYYGSYSGFILILTANRFLFLTGPVNKTSDWDQDVNGVFTLTYLGGGTRTYRIKYNMVTQGSLTDSVKLMSPPGSASPYTVFFDEVTDSISVNNQNVSPCESIQTVSDGFQFDVVNTATSGFVSTIQNHAILIERIA